MPFTLQKLWLLLFHSSYLYQFSCLSPFLGFEISKQCIGLLPLSHNSLLSTQSRALARGTARGVGEGQLETSSQPGPRPPPLRALEPPQECVIPFQRSVREQRGADLRWHSRGIVCSPGWCVTLAPSASSIVEPHSEQSAGVGFFVCCYLAATTGAGKSLAHYCRTEAGPLLTLQS